LLGAALIGCAMLAGCQTPENSGRGDYFECDRGTRLRVDFLRDGALVSVNGGRAGPMHLVRGARGRVYESADGNRLAVNGRKATWNTAARTAPETCSRVAVPL